MDFRSVFVAVCLVFVEFSFRFVGWSGFRWFSCGVFLWVFLVGFSCEVFVGFSWCSWVFVGGSLFLWVFVGFRWEFVGFSWCFRGDFVGRFGVFVGFRRIFVGC